MIETLNCEDAEVVLVVLGSAAGLVRGVVSSLRAQGARVGMLRIRYLRPMPGDVIAQALRGVKVVGMLEKDISFGAEGTVYTNVNSALMRANMLVPTYNFIGGLGGDDITSAQVEGIYAALQAVACGKGASACPRVSFLGIDMPANSGCSGIGESAGRVQVSESARGASDCGESPAKRASAREASLEPQDEVPRALAASTEPPFDRTEVQ